MWNRHQGEVRGIRVEGDKLVSPTKWWNHLYLALWGWKTVTVFEVSDEDARRGYRLGYLPFDGKAMVESKVNHDRQFRMKNGYEDCTFFAFAPADGKEVALNVIARTPKDGAYQHAPLH